MSDIVALRRRAMLDPQALSQNDWNQIFLVAFSVPKKDFSDDDAEIAPAQKQKEKRKKGWW